LPSTPHNDWPRSPPNSTTAPARPSTGPALQPWPRHTSTAGADRYRRPTTPSCCSDEWKSPFEFGPTATDGTSVRSAGPHSSSTRTRPTYRERSLPLRCTVSRAPWWLRARSRSTASERWNSKVRRRAASLRRCRNASGWICLPARYRLHDVQSCEFVARAAYYARRGDGQCQVAGYESRLDDMRTMRATATSGYSA